MILQRYKGGRMANVSHQRLLEILPQNPKFEIEVYFTALDDGLSEPLAFELATKISESAYCNFVQAKTAGIPEEELLQYIREDLPPLIQDAHDQKKVLSNPIETYVLLRTSEYHLSHAEAVEMVSSPLGTHHEGRRIYLTLRRGGCSHAEALQLGVYFKVVDNFLKVHHDTNELDPYKRIELHELPDVLALPIDAQQLLIKVINFYKAL